MDAIILAAGLGTRLRPHTLATPKPLLPIRGRPILDWALHALPPVVDRVLVVTHYLAEQIESYLRGQVHFADMDAAQQHAVPIQLGFELGFDLKGESERM